MKKNAVILCVAALLSAAPGAALAQTYPNQTIKFVVPFSAGSGTDTLARLLGQRVSTALGQNVIVENMAGGSGVIAAQNVVRSAPDGYTVFITSNTTHASNQSLLKKVPYDALRDFAPISHVVSLPNVLVTHPSLPVKTVKELIAFSRARPGERCALHASVTV